MHGLTHHEPIVPGRCQSARLYRPGRAWWIRGFRLRTPGVIRRCPLPLRQFLRPPNSPRPRHLRGKIRMVSRIITKFSGANLLRHLHPLSLEPRYIHTLEKMEMGAPTINILRVSLAQGLPIRLFARLRTTSKLTQLGDHRRAAHNHRTGMSITVSLLSHLRRCPRLSH